MKVHIPAALYGALFLMVTACGNATTASGTSPAPVASTARPPTPSPSRSHEPSPTTPSSVAPLVIIVMENHERADVMASSSASFQRSMARRGRDYTQYFAVAHPSLPNYLAMASGSTGGKTSDDIAAGEMSGQTVWDQLTAAHISWGVYEETMPSACYAQYSAGSFPADYVLKHNPAVPFRSVFSDSAKCARVQPLPQMDPRRLPTVSFITPNECSDAHSCPLSTGDAWLAAHVPPLVRAGADVLVTYDEGTTDLGAGGAGGGNVFAAEIGPGVPTGSEVTRPFDHYSLLAGIEARYGLPALGQASGATALPL